MRTTLDIDDDVLAAAKEISRRQGVSAGRVISKLMRDALAGDAKAFADATMTVAGFRPFPARGCVVSDELIDRLRDREGV